MEVIGNTGMARAPECNPTGGVFEEFLGSHGDDGETLGMGVSGNNGVGSLVKGVSSPVTNLRSKVWSCLRDPALHHLAAEPFIC